MELFISCCMVTTLCDGYKGGGLGGSGTMEHATNISMKLSLCLMCILPLRLLSEEENQGF